MTLVVTINSLRITNDIQVGVPAGIFTDETVYEETGRVFKFHQVAGIMTRVVQHGFAFASLLATIDKHCGFVFQKTTDLDILEEIGTGCSR